MTNEFEGLSNPDLIQVAVAGAKGLAKGRAIDELARRALLDHMLLDAACEAISQERTLLARRGPPLGWLAAGRILDSGDPIAVGRLLRAMDGWTAIDQEDLLHLWAPRERFTPSIRMLKERYDWTPKFSTETAPSLV